MIKKKSVMLLALCLVFTLIQCSEILNEYDDASSTFSLSNSSNSVTEKDPPLGCPEPFHIPISTASELQAMDPSENYCLVKDIILTENFKPIGYPDVPIRGVAPFTGTKFTGILEGHNFSISGLKIKQSGDSYLGLFAFIDSYGSIADLIIKDPYIEGEDYIGVLAGENHGYISNVKIEGDGVAVKGSQSSIGGIVGVNSGHISYSSTTGKTIGEVYVGGIAGDNMGGIECSYAVGDVQAYSYGYGMGGLVGNNTGLIRNSYSSGAVIGNSRVGGFAGQNSKLAEGDFGTIEKCYTIGKVSGIGLKGSFVGKNDGSISKSYFRETDSKLKSNGEGNIDGVTGVHNYQIGNGGKDPFEIEGQWSFDYYWNAMGNQHWPKLKTP